MSDSLSKKEEQGLEYEENLGKALISNIEFNLDNPRDLRGREDVADLKESIREVGVLVPLVVYRKPGEINKFILLEGERRLRACQQLFEETKDERFSRVPVNILEVTPKTLNTLVTMFNMHTKRKRWSKAAEAEALDKILKLTGDLNTSKLATLTGQKDITVEEELTYLNFSRDLRDLVLDYKIPQYSLILMGRNLKALNEAVPEVFAKHDWKEITHSLVKKVRSGAIHRVRDFNTLTLLANNCIQNKNEAVFVSAFDRLIEDPDFNIEDMEVLIRRELSVRSLILFKNECRRFEDVLKGRVSSHRKVDAATYRILQEILESIRKIEVDEAR
jgi:ParB/RepB/Spo0J family partition protein